jgi:hypothetical protein
MLVEIQYSYSDIGGEAGLLSANATKSGEVTDVTYADWRCCGALHVNFSNNAKVSRNKTCVAMQYSGRLVPQYHTNGIKFSLFN